MPGDEKETESRARAVAASAWPLEHAQDLVSVVISMVLIVLAAAELISGIADFIPDVRKSSTEPAGIAVTWFDRRLKGTEPDDIPEQEIS
jgi:hypothetical protein